MRRIEERIQPGAPASPRDRQPGEGRFRAAARARWQRLAEELKADVARLSSRDQNAQFAQEDENRFVITNSNAGLELTLTADFENHTVSYGYTALNQQTSGVPEGGMLSMRESPDGGVEFYSADEQLTSRQTCNVLLEPVQFPGRSCA